MSEAPTTVERVNGLIGHMLKDTVAAGLFSGMRMRDNAVWSDGNYSTKLVGSYEHDLHHDLQTAIERRPRTIVNLGCSDGYYAIGLARLLPATQVIAIDIDQRSLNLLVENARINGVAERITTMQGCSAPEQLCVGHHRRLYVVDVEGHEVDLLNPDRCPLLKTSDIIVECHDFFNPEIHEIVARRFVETHYISLVLPTAPDPNAYPFLLPLPLAVRLLAITEKRPLPTTWLVCWSK